MKQKTKKQKPKSQGKKFDKFISILGKIGAQRHLTVLRDSFATFLPFLIIGAVGMLFITIIFGGWDSSQNSLIGLISKAATGSFDLTGDYALVSEGATKLFEVLPTATIDAISLYVTIFIGWYLSKSRSKDGNFLTTSIISVGVSMFSFLAVTGLNPNWFGAKGLLPAILISMLVTELFIWLGNVKKLQIKMPASVPPAVARAFSKLGAIILTGLIVAAVNYLFVIIGDVSHWNITEKGVLNGTVSEITSGGGPTIVAGANTIDYSTVIPALDGDGNYSFANLSSISHSWQGNTIVIRFTNIATLAGDYGIAGMIYQIFTAPLMSVIGSTSGGLGLAILYVLLVGFLWFLGLHGANMMDGIFLPLWLSALAFNVASQRAGNAPEFIFSQPFFEGFIWVGGGMGTLMLIIGTFIFSRRQEEIEIAKFAIVPGVFNINEPVVFGYPIVMNWRYFVPFVFVMPIQVIVTWLFMGPLGMVAKPSISMPWTTPAILGSLIVTKFDWHAIIPAFINLGIAFVLYVPFIIWGNRGLPKLTRKSKSKKMQEKNMTEKKVKA